MSSQPTNNQSPVVRTTPGRGSRAALRSRNGCQSCKSRRIKCDENHPICAHCARLRLTCTYLTQAAARKQVRPLSKAKSKTPPPVTSLFSKPRTNSDTDVSLATANVPTSQESQDSAAPSDCARNDDDSWNSLTTDFGANHGFDGFWIDGAFMQFAPAIPRLSPLWEGHSFDPVALENVGTSTNVLDEAVQASYAAAPENVWPPETGGRTGGSNLAAGPTSGSMDAQLFDCSDQQNNGMVGVWGRESNHLSTAAIQPIFDLRSLPHGDDNTAAYLLPLFQRVVQPPASYLVGGVRKWRRLQHYLVEQSGQNELVLNALLSVIELLFIEDVSQRLGQDRETCLKRIITRHDTVLASLQTAVVDACKAPSQPTDEQHLAALFLLAWFEVMRDQDGHETPFSRELADAIILRDTEWSQRSSDLMSWLGTLDSRATHLSGDRRLFSERALHVLARHPYQVVSSNAEDQDDEIEHESLDLASTHSKHTPPDSLLALDEHGDSLHTRSISLLPRGHIKQIFLSSLIQPAVEWYTRTQRFCRRIGSHSRHHRPRGTPDDEYAVIKSSKQLEQNLMEIWDQRPTTMALSKDQMCAFLPSDLALRLHEIFSVHLACYWILFVYLHRVVWWSLPHSPTTRSALNQVWNHFQNGQGEMVDGVKVVHPALLWPVFLFGSETPDESKQVWCIQQLEALGKSKPILQTQLANRDTLPPFQMSAGATRNAKRAAQLLKELIQRQTATKARVDDRDLSMELFGCYFSLV